MKQVIYNQTQAEEEKRENEALLKEQEQRKLYLSQLKKNKLFQKYVMEEILLKELQSNKDISSNFSMLIGASPEEVKSVMLAKSAGMKTCENIINKITLEV